MALALVALCFSFLHQTSAAILNINEGESCQALGGGPGKCTLLSKCRDPGDFRRDQPPICMFKGNEPYICCPPALSTSAPAGTRAKQYCGRMNKTCQTASTSTTISPSVEGGKNTKPKERKYTVLIGYGNTESKHWGCAGSLVTHRYILSAAHCAQPQQFGPAKWARLGDLDPSSNKDEAGIQERRIVRRIVHPAYKEPGMYNDIAIFKIDREIEFDSRAGPVCLHTDKEIPLASGAIVPGSATSERVPAVQLDIFDDTDCRNLLSNESSKTPKGIDTNLMFCAKRRDGSTGACSGDSGGPLVITSGNSDCLKTQIGIASFGNECGLPSSPGVYTRISSYIAWIEDIVYFNQTGLR